MKNLNSVAKLLCVVVLAVSLMAIVPGLVQASNLSYSVTASISEPTDWSGDLSLPQFDPVNGTLSQVTLDLIGGLNTSFMVGNLSTASSSSGNVSSQSTFTISSGTLGLNLSPLTLTAGVPFSLQAGELPVYPLSASQMGLNSYNIPSALLQDFTGTGVVSLPASTSTQTILTYGNGSPYVNPPPSPTATMTAVATYYYSPAVVPEPSTFALLGVSIIGLLGYSWRRRK